MAQAVCMPKSLYNYSIASVVNNYSFYQKEIETFSDSVTFDIFEKLYKEKLFNLMKKELENVNSFQKLLRVHSKRCLLHKIFQTMLDQNFAIKSALTFDYEEKCKTASFEEKKNLINLGILLGDFMVDSGWFPESEIIFECTLQLCSLIGSCKIRIYCYKRILHIQNMCGKFQEAMTTIKNILKLNLESGIKCEIANFYLLQNKYNEAFSWSINCLMLLDSNSSQSEIVNILCIISEVCMVNEQIKQAEFVIKQAVQRSREAFGEKSLFYAGVLQRYGYFLLHVDAVSHSILVYQNSLDIFLNVLGGENIMVALAYKNLAYAEYVNNYSNGRFKDAYDYIKKAINIKGLLGENHFMLKEELKIFALIIEEIAIDSDNIEYQNQLFAKAEMFHISTLQINIQYFGELNIQTAKEYGNLGRLYQSMKKFEVARQMHLKALSIKQQIFGENHYEVAISMSHLASLYNYDLCLYDEAIKLYQKSIEITIKQRGNDFSGLEYDYEGLKKVFIALNKEIDLLKVNENLQNWKLLRNIVVDKYNNTRPLNIKYELVHPENLYKYFTDLL